MWSLAAVIFGAMGALLFIYRQGVKSAFLRVFKDEQNKIEKINKEWDAIDAERKEKRDESAGDADSDPGDRWQ